MRRTERLIKYKAKVLQLFLQLFLQLAFETSRREVQTGRVTFSIATQITTIFGRGIYEYLILAIKPAAQSLSQHVTVTVTQQGTN